MGDLTRAQLRTEIIANLGGRSSLGSGAGLDTLNRALDRAQTRIQRSNTSGWSELIVLESDALIIDDSTFSIADGLNDRIDKIRSLYTHKANTTSSVTLIGLSTDVFNRLIGNVGSKPNGRPAYYVDERFGSTLVREIRMWPKPDEAYNLWQVLQLKVTAFTDDSMVSDFEDKDDLIIALTTSYMFTRYQQFEESDALFKMYSNQLQTAIINDKNKPDIQHVPFGLGIHNAGINAINSWQDPFRHSNRGRY